ncbi:MAG TPA: acetoin utilization protein AcuC, partial [Streptosporangiaceae bacterium]
MTCSLAVSWDDQLTSYDFGPGHPLAPVRVELTMALAREFGVF